MHSQYHFHTPNISNTSLISNNQWSRSVVSDSLRPHGLHSRWNSPGQNTGVGNLSLLQGIFPTQGSNPSLPHCRWILYQLSHKGRPKLGVKLLISFSKKLSLSWISSSRKTTRTFSSVQSLSCVRLFATPWTMRSVEFSRAEYWSG